MTNCFETTVVCRSCTAKSWINWRSGGKKHLLLDLELVRGITSAGLNMLIRIGTSATRKARRCTCATSSRGWSKCFRKPSFVTLFRIHDDVVAGLEHDLGAMRFWPASLPRVRGPVPQLLIADQSPYARWIFRRRIRLRQPGPAPLLRRLDQATVALLLAVSLLLMAITACTRHWQGQGLIEIDHAPPLAIDFRVDINRADWPELALLPDVGETLARRIVESRQRDGPFLDQQDLLRVPGIGPLHAGKNAPLPAPLAKHPKTLPERREIA